MSVESSEAASRKVYVGGGRPGVKVPMREVQTRSGSVRLYDTSGPYSDPGHVHDLRNGLFPLRREWTLARGDVEPGGSGRLRALSGRNVTQMHYARRGEITPEMEFIAIREGATEEDIRSEVASAARLFRQRQSP